MTFLRTRTDDEHALITANYQHNGPHMRAKRIPGKNMYKFFKGLSKEFGRLEGYLNSVTDGAVITDSTDMLTEHERMVGVPDDYFPANGTASDRQKHVIAKLAAEGVSTASDLSWLCSLLGFSVEVKPGHYYWLNPDPRVSFSSERESRFTVVFVVNFLASDPEVQPNVFPVPFPWVFTSNNYNIMQDFMLSIIPANCNGIWISSEPEVYKDLIGDSDVYKDEIGAVLVYKDKIGS